MLTLPRPLALALGALALLTACPSDTKQIGVQDTGEPGDGLDSVLAEVEDSADATATQADSDAEDTTPDGDDTDSDAIACMTPAVFGCPCTGNGDCLDEMCIEGPDGNVCTRSCSESCPEGLDCLNVSLGGPDPVSICVPRHTRLCRPCDADQDCQNSLDPAPAVCLEFPHPEDGHFCATSCAGIDCPEGYVCNDVDLGTDRGTAKLCLPTSGTCECRPSWSELALETSCRLENEFGGCDGVRVCGADGLTACSGATPAIESCNKIDDDCDGVTDNIAADDCTNQNDFGRCAGTYACDAQGALTCAGPTPGPERCNNIDDNCNGQTDEAWTDCLPAGCNATDGGYIETGAASCVNAQCVYASPKPCGLYTCDGGGDAGDECASACNDDSTCIASAHCDELAKVCVPDVPNGGACQDASDCASGHCQNGFCCGDGDCCSQPTNCPASYTSAATCESGSTCQGTRRDARCTDSQCATSDPIPDDSGCGVEVLAIDCSPYLPRYCNGAAAQTAPACASTCASDGDCANGYHCDGTCVPDVVDGTTCDEDTDCVSDHCENNFCCKAGDCCAQGSDCPALYRVAAHCLDGQSCQGERTDAVCTEFECKTQVVQDDSGCDGSTVANECGPYASAKCTGAATQSAPQCPFTCQADSECDSGFHCDFVCVPNLPDGNYCDENSDCSNGHCSNNICCVGGDCCNAGRDCPASYSGAPACDFPQTCQGTKDSAVCVNHVCGTTAGAADDSACTNATVANDCGAYPAVRCNGGADQLAPACATSCDSNSACDSDAYCDHGTCRPKQGNGGACSDPSQCTSGHCQNGFCCGAGDCCATGTDCSAATYGTPAACDNQASCQGTRKNPVCESNQCKLGPVVGDDSACSGLEASKCGYFDSVFCTAAQDQTAPACATSCTGNSVCDDGAHCETNTCKPDLGVGGLCPGGQAQCGAGLTCVDGVCCQTACGGTCKRCDVGGNLGICQNSGSGTDPDNECAGVSCTGYYWGFDVKTCYARAAVADTGVQCNGSGVCQTPSDLCPAAAKGAATVTCHAQCQSPTAGTCSGTTPGSCTNITGGTQTCGVGACQRTIDLCSNGAPQTCTAGTPTAEVCDGIDNDCDGLTDAADPNLVLVPCDNQNGVCAGSTKPKTLCVGGQWQPCTDTNYAAYTALYQSGHETTCETTATVAGKDNDCDGETDEDFSYTSPAGTVVQGASKACGVGVCAGGTTVCATASTLTCSKDNLIAAESCDGKDNDCDGVSDASDSSLVLDQPCANQTGVCSGSKKPATLCSAGVWQACSSATYTAYSSLYEVTETKCDGYDNDCAGGADNGLSAPLNSNQTGVCAGSHKSCGGTSGWQENLASAPNYNANEGAPSSAFLDENCDGIDGTESAALFVSAGGTGTTCSKAAPCSFTQALATTTAKTHIYMMAGSYSPGGNGTYNVTKPWQIYGGYSGTWVRAARTSNAVNVNAGTYNGETIALRISATGTSTSNRVLISDVNIIGANAGTAGKSSYAVWIKGTWLSLLNCDVRAGNGAPGTPGAPGTDASVNPPSQANPGTQADEYATWCNTDRQPGGGGRTNSCADGGYSAGGGGGAGGQMDTSCNCCTCSNCDATAGLSGGAGISTGASSDGGSGSGGGTCSWGYDGGTGGVSHGSRGTGAANAYGAIFGDLFVADAGGTGWVGSHGGAGGGGGGSGGCDTGTDSKGAGGGGGGAGGCSAPAAGGGGTGGGGSFGIFAIDANMTVTGCVFARGAGGVGGAGGRGGSGQPGGAGGAGGSGFGDSYGGGNGGAGGVGGHSGGGGGGAGGPSYGIFWYRSSPSAGSLSQSGNDLGVGSGGSGGSGGTGTIAATTGTAGATGDSRGTCEKVGNSCQ